MRQVPLAAPGRFLPAEASAIDEAVARVLASGTWVIGDEVSEFERAFATYTGARDVVGCASGTDALVLSLTALGLETGSEVLVPGHDGGYGALAATLAGLRPVVYDIDATIAVPTVATLDAVTTHSTSALIVTHLHGDLVDLVDIDSWRSRRGLALVEDCAQASGLRGAVGHVGSTGDVAAFSFYPTKNLGAVGDGGAVLVGGQHGGLSDRVRSLRQYGWSERHRIDRKGGRNSRLDEIQAAILSARLPHLDERNRRRLALLDRWVRALEGCESVERISGGPTVAHHIVVTFRTPEARRSAAEQLEAEGIATAVHYPVLVHEMGGLVTDGPIPMNAMDRRDRIMSLPAEPLLDEDECIRVVAALNRLN